MPDRWSRFRTAIAGEWAVATHGPVDWFLLGGNRLLVSGGLLAVVAAVVWWSVASGLAPLEAPTPILYLLFVLVSGNFTLVAIVVSISQFVLARHLESPGEVREKLREIVGYRQEVSEVTRASVVPVTAAGFLLVLFEGIRRDATELRDREWSAGGPEVADDVDALADDLQAHAAQVIDLLEGDRGIRRALFATLEMDYSRFFYGAYRLRAEHGDDLPPSVAETLDRLERHVEQVDVARRYFKTVLIQTELAALSRYLLYIGVPVLVATVVLMLAFTDPRQPPIRRPVLEAAIPLVVTVGFAPILLLTTYILRLSTVVRRTAAMYPFTTAGDE